MDADLIDAGGHVDFWFAVFRHLSGHSRPQSLEASIQDRRVDLIGAELSIRPIRNLHLTQHFTVAIATTE